MTRLDQLRNVAREKADLERNLSDSIPLGDGLTLAIRPGYDSKSVYCCISKVGGFYVPISVVPRLIKALREFITPIAGVKS